MTRAYNLPAQRVIHTAGHIAGGRPSDRHRDELGSIVFCCISTGVFGFPGDEAAHIAVRTVRAWLGAHPSACLRVIFNVFLDEDAAIYRRLLSA